MAGPTTGGFSMVPSTFTFGGVFLGVLRTEVTEGSSAHRARLPSRRDDGRESLQTTAAQLCRSPNLVALEPVQPVSAEGDRVVAPF